MQRDFAFVQISPRRLFVGWGPFEQLPFRRPDRPAFYVTDFFLDDPHPWRHPAQWEEIDVDELAARFPVTDVPDVAWEPPSISEFAALFDSARDGIRAGDFNKIVPVVFEEGRFTRRGDFWGYFFDQLRRIPERMRIYGYAHHNHGVVGATPEVLFDFDGRSYRTMALAGTRPAARAAELLGDAKELREHRLVVDDIVGRLAPFGNVEVGALGVLEMPTIAHLATSIRFEKSGPETMPFGEMVRRLHPTAALGVSPRTEAGERWLREADRGVKRRTFGAPFGLEVPRSGAGRSTAMALVAIRNVAWQSENVRVGAGAGILAESRVDREFEELAQKRDQVKALFGLPALSSEAAIPAARNDQH